MPWRLQWGAGQARGRVPVLSGRHAIHCERLEARTFMSTSPTGITPAQMRHFYAVDSIRFGSTVGDGTGQTIAIVDPYDDPTALNDLKTFDATFHLPDPQNFTKVDENGGTNLPSTDPSSPGTQTWEVEESLDVEWAHAIAPGANLVLVEAISPGTSDLFQAVSTAASLPGVVAVSMSFGGRQSFGDSQNDSTFTTPAGHNGVTFLAATGDNGAPGGYPAFSPNVVAVGGTQITLGTGGGYGSEAGWSGSGGGFSRFEPEPSWQQSVQNTGERSIPDVSMDASPQSGVPVYDSYDFGASSPWIKVGGTSLATPMWAGLIAIADQGRALAGMNSLDGPTQTLPRLYSLPSADFHDITSGFNGRYSAGPGYDEGTGIGTPVANLLVPDLAGVALPDTQDVVTGTSGNDTITLTRDADGVDIDWSLNGGPIYKVAINDAAGLTINANGGTDTIVLDSSNGDPLPNLLKLNGGAFTVQGLTAAIGPGNTIDVGTSTVMIPYTGASPLATVQGLLRNGYNTGAWNGSGIISSAAAADTRFAIADIDTGSAIRLQYALEGNATLSGQVGFNDLVVLSRNYGQSGADWSKGDFNYDGAVGFDDLVILARNYGTSATNAAAIANAAAAPLAAAISDNGSLQTPALSKKHRPARFL